MDNKTKRIMLFLLGCIPMRIGITYLVMKQYNKKYAKLLVFLLTAIGLGFAYIYLNGLRKTGMEVFGDKIWWNNWRPFHSAMYLIAALLIIKQNKNAYLPIALDTTVGLILFLRHHFS